MPLPAFLCLSLVLRQYLVEKQVQKDDGDWSTTRHLPSAQILILDNFEDGEALCDRIDWHGEMDIFCKLIGVLAGFERHVTEVRYGHMGNAFSRFDFFSDFLSYHSLETFKSETWE